MWPVQAHYCQRGCCCRCCSCPGHHHLSPEKLPKGVRETVSPVLKRFLTVSISLGKAPGSPRLQLAEAPSQRPDPVMTAPGLWPVAGAFLSSCATPCLVQGPGVLVRARFYEKPFGYGAVAKQAGGGVSRRHCSVGPFLGVGLIRGSVK